MQIRSYSSGIRPIQPIGVGNSLDEKSRQNKTPIEAWGDGNQKKNPKQDDQATITKDSPDYQPGDLLNIRV